MRACTRARCFSPYIPAFLALCTPESLLRLTISNMTILPAKQAACDLCGLHGSAMQRLPVDNWSAIVLLKTWRCGGDAHVHIYIYLSVSIFVYICIITYEMTYTFQILASLLTIIHTDIRKILSVYIRVHMSIHTYQLCTYLCTLIFHIFTHHIP